MGTARILDTFPAFLDYWRAASALPLEAQIDAWADDYMAQWPELLQMQQQGYADTGLDWWAVAREKVFPFLPERLAAMRAAHRHLLAECIPTYAQAQAALEFDGDVTFVIYVGIGLGAGWATEYEGTPAVLYGLENIAECGWSDAASIRGVTAHELGHLLHFAWRRQVGKAKGSGPWWQLYEEGFARRCESIILGTDVLHEARGLNPAGFLDWCRAQQGWLAAEYLRRVEAGASVREFFGSWYDLRGWKQTGYFLGHEVIKALETELSLREIARLDDLEAPCRRILRAFADVEPFEE